MTVLKVALQLMVFEIHL